LGNKTLYVSIDKLYEVDGKLDGEMKWLGGIGIVTMTLLANYQKLAVNSVIDRRNKSF